MSKTISLVLGSGGARGLAHIGIIHWLEEHGYEIKSISSCSIGAAVGGAYAAGQLQGFETWIRSFDRKDVFSMMDFVLSKDGFVKGDKIMSAINEIIGSKNIEELDIKFTAVAADIAKEEEVWINSGPINDAIRASISLPLFFTPFEHSGRPLIDGGILNPTPTEPVANDETDMMIAVNLGGKPLPELDDKEEDEDEDSFFFKKYNEFLERLDWGKKETKKEWDLYYILDQSFNSMQNTIAAQKMKIHRPDILIDIPRNKCGTLEFDRANEMIDYGYEMAEKVLEEKLSKLS
ncbi:patatin-like phospholipase family protein [Reichenbachiella ulvae]|uniref:Patatin-like phospholipase family protein n=1 Tax=Reichenbachiella ulvae TaxID=2980104 RepID=A0ABT3CXW7_9BACT|nr:patatin-like phospholipase family protein [Reichenbachiella ulvae]MCV9388404.1 patatin-like phospholipase family protein [Reichenbachiella ulvae]